MKNHFLNRIVIQILIPLYLYSFLFQYLWEMVQMPLYSDMYFSSLQSWTACAKATVGDAHIAAFMWLAGALVYQDVWWFKRLTFLKTLIIVIMGTGITLFLEIHALRTGRWEYSALMPVVPLLEVGIVPILQMTLLPLLIFHIITKRGTRDH